MSQLRLQQTHFQRRPLLVVQPRVSRKPALTVAFITGISFLAIVLLELLLTIGTSQGVYQIADLKAEKKNLVESTQILGSEVDSLSSPQNLSNAAASLGMIANANPVFLSIEKQKVSGKPMAALSGYQSRISRNLVPNAELVAQTNASDLKTVSDPVSAETNVAPVENTVNQNVATERKLKPPVVSTVSRIPASPTN